jgi:hypothetical protein
MLWDALVMQALDALCRREHDVRVGLMPIYLNKPNDKYLMKAYALNHKFSLDIYFMDRIYTLID